MSKRFRELRIQKNISKSDLADLLNVSYRTISNWEKDQGTLPNINLCSEIAKIFGTSTYNIYDTFMPKTDNDTQIDDQEFELAQNINMKAKKFFRYLFKDQLGERILGAGIIQYKSLNFKFDIAMPIYREINYELLDFGEPIKRKNFTLTPINVLDNYNLSEDFEYPYGFFVADKNMNIIVFDEKNIKSCRFIRNQFGNVSFELIVGIPFFADMENEINLINQATINLTFFDYCRNSQTYQTPVVDWLSQYQFDFDSTNIIGRFIQAIRKSQGLNQTEFADCICTPPQYEISNKTVNKWETGITKPSLLQLFFLAESYDFSVKKLLDQFDGGFFMKNSIVNQNRSYPIGINYFFEQSAKINKWIEFISTFKLAHSVISGILDNRNTIGVIRYNGREFNLSDIYFDDNAIFMKLGDLSEMNIQFESIKSISNENQLCNLLYQTTLTLKDNQIITLLISFFAKS